MSGKKPQVFISYAWENDEFRAQVRELRDWLISQGITVVSDFDHGIVSPEPGWQHWMQHAAQYSAVVLVVCSPKYKARYEKCAPETEGKGVTWEAVFLVQDLYNRAMRNDRIYPIFPDPINFADCPTALEPWSNGHAFPSAKEKILALVQDRLSLLAAPHTVPAAVPTSPPPSAAALGPGLLRGPSDTRLAPREGRVYGRSREVTEVLNFLRGTETGAVVCAMVAGAGGIGKTEVCKAALHEWLGENTTARAWFIVIPEQATAADLLYRIGCALGLGAQESFQQLSSQVQPGLYYLDNLEAVAESAEAQRLLKDFLALPQVRMLASSRVKMSSVLRKTIEVGVLPESDALQLFRDLWTGGEALPDDAQLRPFVILDLGAHALSISLCARLGDTWAWRELTGQWKKQGVALACLPGEHNREGSLTVSVALTAQALQNKPGALDLWTAAALFPYALAEEVMHELEEAGAWPEARGWLVKYHVLTRHEDGFHMLPPLARFALAESLQARNGFDWMRCRQVLQPLLTAWADAAAPIASTDQVLQARRKVLTYFETLGMAMRQEMACPTAGKVWLGQIVHALSNHFQFRAVYSRELLQEMRKAMPDFALVCQKLGDLEMRLGQLAKAREHYQAALPLYEAEQDGLGRANTLRSLGDLERRLGQLDKARGHYQAARRLYEEEQYGLGRANTLRSLGDLEMRLGQLDKAREHYQAALPLYEEEQDDLGRANILCALGDLEMRLGQLDKARGHYQAALSLYEAEQSGLGRANILCALGDLEMRLGQLDKARGHYQAAQALYEAEQSGWGRANTLQSMGDLERKANNNEHALAHYQNAVPLYIQEQEPFGLANTLIELARLHHDMHQQAERDQTLRQLLPLLQNRQSINSEYIEDVLNQIFGSMEAFADWRSQNGAQT